MILSILFQSDNCRMEMQYAKKTVHKPLIPIIVGASEGGWDWQASVVGMLIAGERYIDFKKKTAYDEKFEDLQMQVKNLGAAAGPTADNVPSVTAEKNINNDIFISYCWTNSHLSAEAGEIKNLVGTEWNDPRYIKKLLSDKYKVWLDIEQLTSGQTSGMFEQITSGLLNSKCVFAFISSDYAKSDNCKMEFQFAVKSLKKPFIPICVGEDTGWVASMIGALVSGSGEEVVELIRADEEDLAGKMEKILSKLNAILGDSTEEIAPPSYASCQGRAPQVGDHVISLHFKHAYYTSTILSFDKEEMTYHIAWDDGDPTGRNPPYNQVGLNEAPDRDDIGVGELVFFPQGGYGGTEGNNTGGVRYHQGLVTACEERDGVRLYSGHHTKGEQDGKWVTYRGYQYTFDSLTVEQLRIAPNAMDALYTAE